MNAVKFTPNRVWRVYQGGSGIDELRRAETRCDGSFPEDWIASTSEANNPQYPAENQGLSKIVTPDGGEQFFHEYLAADPENTLGKAHFARHGANAALLMKILDAAERLPIQVHPTVPDAERYFNSKFGKTEAWYVVAVREVNGEAPYLLFGFNDKLDKETFLDEARHGDFPTGKGMLHKLAVKPGDCFIVPGGTPHAIGCGCTIIEVMEPSDLVVQPEFFCGKQRLSDSERWSNADPEDALKSFIFKSESEAELRKRCSPGPEKIDESLTRLIPYSLAHYFEVQKLQCSGSYRFTNRENIHRAGVVTAGDLLLKTADGTLELHRGDAFFLPYALKECVFSGSGEIIFALPPMP